MAVAERSYVNKFDDSRLKQCRRIGQYEVCLFQGGYGCQSSIRAWIKPAEDAPRRDRMLVSYQLFEGEYDHGEFIYRTLRSTAEVERMFDECKRNGGGSFAEDRL